MGKKKITQPVSSRDKEIQWIKYMMAEGGRFDPEKLKKWESFYELFTSGIPTISWGDVSAPVDYPALYSQEVSAPYGVSVGEPDTTPPPITFEPVVLEGEVPPSPPFPDVFYRELPDISSHKLAPVDTRGAVSLSKKEEIPWMPPLVPLPKEDTQQPVQVAQEMQAKVKEPMDKIPPYPKFHDEEIAQLIAQLANLPRSEYKIEPPASTAELALASALAGLASIGSQAAEAAWRGLERGLEKASERKRTEAYYRWLEGVRATTRQIQAIRAKIAQLQNIDARAARLWEAKLRALMRQHELQYKFAMKMAEKLASQKLKGKTLRGAPKGKMTLQELFHSPNIKIGKDRLAGEALKESFERMVEAAMAGYSGNTPELYLADAIRNWLDILASRKDSAIAKKVNIQKEKEIFEKYMKRGKKGLVEWLHLHGLLNDTIKRELDVREYQIKQQAQAEKQVGVAKAKQEFKNPAQMAKKYVRESTKFMLKPDEDPAAFKMRVADWAIAHGGSEGVANILKELDYILKNAQLTAAERGQLETMKQVLEGVLTSLTGAQ